MRTAAPCRSSTASSPVRTSASPCPSAQSATRKRIRRRRNRRMRREQAVKGAKAAAVVTFGFAEAVVTGVIVTILACLGGCADLLPRKDTSPPVLAPVVDRQAASATLISGYLENLQRLVQSAPA